MVHQFKNNGYNIVMDVNSGAVHIVDDLVYDIIYEMNLESGDSSRSSCGSQKTVPGSQKTFNDSSEYEEAYKEVKNLIDQGKLFTKDTYMPYLKSFDSRPIVVKAICMHIAHDCNLACKYCFAGKGEYQGERELMSPETGKKAIDFLVANSGNRKHLEVDFFGGEPTMNMDTVKQVVDYARKLEKTTDKVFRFTLTTNGLLLNDDMFDYINKEMSNVVLSIDGRKEVNDRMRPLRSGKGSSYDIILPEFKKLADSRDQERYYVRGTFTHGNTDFSKDVLHLADQGFKQISVEPVVAAPEEEYAITQDDLPKIFEEYDTLAKEIVKRKKEGKDFNFFHFMIDIDGGPCVAKRLQGCGSGCEYLSVTPSGDLYPCHQFVGNEAMKLGDVDSGVTNTDLRAEFRKSNVYSKPACQDCFAKFYCSGGCAANAFNHSGDINGNYETGCEMQRKRVECALMIKAAEAMGDTVSEDK